MNGRNVSAQYQTTLPPQYPNFNKLATFGVQTIECIIVIYMQGNSFSVKVLGSVGRRSYEI